MITIRQADERGTTETTWLHSRHTFSFGGYRDPRHMGFRSLRVVNDDVVEAGRGFDTHAHRDMEIVSIVLEGELEHRDSLGHGAVLRPGDVQTMTAGRGIMHSEFNPSSTSRVHFIQVWLHPERPGLTPAYAQRAFPDDERRNTFRRVAGRTELERDQALPINQDASVLVATLDERCRAVHEIEPGRAAWLQVMRGAATVNGHAVRAGDGVALEDEPRVEAVGDAGGCEMLLFDLA